MSARDAIVVAAIVLALAALALSGAIGSASGTKTPARDALADGHRISKNIPRVALSPGWG
ncbi:MAG: hypothetical protein JJE35_15255 [Thermoleophilia bacterium]|nr:hypothetical protein [Thermoleophilia bacterium]